MKNIEKQLNVKYMAIQFMAFGALSTLFGSASGIFLSSKGFSTSSIGTALAIVSALGVVVQPAIATFADKHQEISLQKIITASILASVFCAIIVYTLKSASFVLLASFVGLLTFVMATMPLLNSLAFSFEKYGININFGLARGMGSAAWAISSYVVLALAEKMGAQILPILYIILNFIFIVILNSFKTPANLTPVKQEETNKEVEVQEEQLGLFEFVKKYKTFMIFVGGSVLVFFTHTVINNFLFQIAQGVGGTESSVGTATAIAAIVELPAMGLYEKIQDKLGGCGKVLVLSSVAFMLKHALTAFAPNMMTIYVACFLQVAGYALFLPASVYLGNKVCEAKDRNKAQSLIAVGSTASGIIANLCGGVLIDAMGVRPVLIIGIAVSALGLFVVSYAMKGLKSELA